MMSRSANLLVYTSGNLLENMTLVGMLAIGNEVCICREGSLEQAAEDSVN